MSFGGSLGAALHRRWPALRRSVIFPMRAAAMGLRLPPGRLDPVQEREVVDQGFLLERARRHGPIFKMMLNSNYTTCIIGHELGRQLIVQHDDHLPGLTVDLHAFCPHGAVRGMAGATHQSYRRGLMRAIQATSVAVHERSIRQVIRDLLARLEAAPHGGRRLREEIRRAASDIMVKVLFGLEPDTSGARALVGAYRRFGPEAPVAMIQENHAEAFREILAQLRATAADEPGAAADSVLHHLASQRALDETMLVNLAYLFEPSHTDVYSLWHWVLDLVGSSADVQKAYASAPDVSKRRQYARAVVQESLRLQQSELLYRRVTRDLPFEGLLIPRGTTVRVCIWEAHHDASVFPEPHAFRPERFLDRNYGANNYAPFGMGPRHCLGSQFVMDVTTMFVGQLLDAYRVQVDGSARSVRGAYHWEPHAERIVRMSPRGG